MEFEWDDEKSEGNLSKHGIGFDDAMLVFLDPYRVTFLDDRFEYGEERLNTFGEIEGRIFAVTFTEREDAIRIISARKANKRERSRYANHAENT